MQFPVQLTVDDSYQEFSTCCRSKCSGFLCYLQVFGFFAVNTQQIVLAHVYAQVFFAVDHLLNLFKVSNVLVFSYSRNYN